MRVTGVTVRRPLAAALLAAGLFALGVSRAGEESLAVQPIDRAAYETPGRLVGVPHHRQLNFRCLGRGAPTVLLEAGFGASSQAWGRVQPKVAQLTRVCAYDRAGYGFSNPGPLPRDGAAIARDLDAGLRAAGISGPYVVVGHSAGGLYARLFAARRRTDVVGLVFVDPSVEYQERRMAAIFGPGAGSVDGIRRRVARCLELTQASPTVPENPALQECAPTARTAQARKVGLRPATWRDQASEINSLFTTTSDEVSRVGGLLQDIPAIVLTASPRADGIAAGPDDPAAAAWQEMHQTLAAGFRQGDHRLVRSTHLMMNDRPEVVVAAISELVVQARRR